MIKSLLEERSRLLCQGLICYTLCSLCTQALVKLVLKRRQAAKKASMENQGSVTGDLAQPLTRRHSRSSSTVSLGRAMSRGQSMRLDTDWDISPKTTPSKDFVHEDGTGSDDDEDAKKDS